MVRKLRQGCVVVLDVGKTLAKLTLWSPEGRLIERRTRPNEARIDHGYPSLDVEGVTDWLAATLSEFSRRERISAIIPVAHGAGACVVAEGELLLPPLDYEAEPPAEILARYRAERDAFALTGSPALPAGLNLGAQLFWLESMAPKEFARGQIVTWAQYWSWLLSGVAATEVSSLGTHTDLWLPLEGKPSPMAERLGWAARFASLRKASDVLGALSDEWSARTGLPRDCVIVCGVHDSNAALLAARSAAGEDEFTVLSTGTWFVAMRAGAETTPASLPENRDCLLNVDVFGRAVPSSRLMGGREAEILEDAGAPLDVGAEAEALTTAASEIVQDGIFALPSFQEGVGPFAHRKGSWAPARPDGRIERRAAAGLYLALMADVSLELIGSRNKLIVEGRFADDSVFTGALASLRKEPVFVSQAHNNVPAGALALLGLARPKPLKRIEPLDFDIAGYADRWRRLTEEDPAPGPA